MVGFYIVASIIFLISIPISIYLYSYTNKLKNFDTLIEEALPDFNIDVDGRQIITEGEVTIVINRHQELYNSVVKIKHYILPWYKESLIPRFIDVYDNYSKRISEQNRKNQTRLLIEKLLPEAKNELKTFSFNRFFAHSEWYYLKNKYKDLIDAIKLVPILSLGRFFFQEDLDYVYKSLTSNADRKEKNKAFIAHELETKKTYFDELLNYPLDMQQRDAIVKSEDNCLVIASAGSGKTSTIVGKARYLLDYCDVLPSEMLLITFTKKASLELKERIGNEELECKTFHKYALDIVTRFNNERPSICDTNNNNAYDIVFDDLLKNDDFRSSLLDYYSSGQLILSHDYKTAQDYYRDSKKYGIIALLPDMDGRKIYTKSIEEKTICFLLASLGLDFRYEEKYEFNTANRDYGQYKPDFSIYYQDEHGYRKRIYLEHFAINRKSHVPQWFAKENESWEAANKKYNDGINWKRQLHKNNRTVLIETHSYDFHEDNILEVLKSELRRVGVPFHPVPVDQLYQNVTRVNKKIQSVAFKMLSSFINLMKSNCKSIDELILTARKQKDKRNAMIMSSIIKPFYEAYCKYLQDRGEVDFYDIIAQATEICKKNDEFRKYKYILIDEFQDISFDRYKLVQATRSSELFTKLFCVGDDWQSIYRFTGSDMQLFSKFSDFFGCTEECKIETTYRFSEPAISYSSEFVMKNPVQRQKRIRPFNPQKVTDLSFASYIDKDNGLAETVSDIIDTIPPNKTVFILGRYNFDIDNLAGNSYEYESPLKVHQPQNRVPYITTCNNPAKHYPFFSVHSSKGLEADYIIVINCNSGAYGFPATIEDDPVLIYVLSENDHFTFAEERRLFYVAITRAKEHTYVVYDREHPSDFVMEIDGNKDSGNPVCPRCKNGNLEVRREGVTRYGHNYKWCCCNNYVCDYSKTEFE